MISQNISNLPIFLDIIIICSSHFLEFISDPQNKHYNQQCVFLFLKEGFVDPTNEFIYLFDFFSLLPGTHYKESKAYSQQTLALSILLTALLALVAGFTVGLLVSRRCHQQKQLHLAEIYDKTLNFTK